MIENEFWTILLVEDDEDDYFIVYKMLSDTRKGRFALDWASSYRAGLQSLQAKTYDAVLVDYDLGEETGDRWIAEAAATGCQAPMLILTGRGSYDIDVKTMQAGAYDYLNKGELNASFLERSIRYAVERKRAENALASSNAALRAAERRARDILAGITDCYFLIDPNGCMIDINANALAFLNCTAADMLDKMVWETDLLIENPDAAEYLRSVAATGRPAHFETQAKPLARWADVHAYPVAEGIAVYFADITRRKRTEQHTKFLAGLGEKLIALDDPDIMITSSLEAITDYLGVDHCVLEKVLAEQATTTILAEYHTGQYRMMWEQDRADYQRAFYRLRQNGESLLVENCATDSATAPLYEALFRPLEINAYLGIPHFVEGQWVNMLTVATAAPRQWRADEIILLRQSADLIWLAVENARLLQNLKITQARFDIALKNSEITVYTADRDLRYTWLYRPMPPYLSEQVIGLRDEDLPQAEQLAELSQLKRQVLESRVGMHKEIALHIGESDQYLDITIEPYESQNGEIDGIIVSCVNTTSFHQMEAQVEKSIAQVALQRKIMESRENERKEISRDLHDGPIQNAIGLLFSIETALTLTQEASLREIIVSIREEAQLLVSELRGICNQLRPPILTQFGLAGAIRSYTEEFKQKHPQFTLRLDLYNDGQTLPETIRLALYRVCQEGLSNIVRHSQATEIKIAYQLEGQRAVLTLEDNGEGCHTPIDWQRLIAEGHLGLVGMKERTEALNGRLDVVCSQGVGTRIQAVIPYSSASEAVADQSIDH